MTRKGTRSKNKSTHKKDTCFESPLVLYLVLAGVLINLFSLLYNRDDKSIFLLIIISAIVYSITNNMIIVLVTSIIIVNSLILLKKLLQNNTIHIEGYTDNLSNVDYIDIHEKVLKFIDENPASNEDGENYTDDIDNQGNIYDIVESVINNRLFDNNDKFLKDDYDKVPVDELMDFISYIYNNYDDTDSNDQIIYILDLYDYIHNTPEEDI